MQNEETHSNALTRRGEGGGELGRGGFRGGAVVAVASGENLCIECMVRCFGRAFRVRDENPTKEAHVLVPRSSSENA